VFSLADLRAQLLPLLVGAPQRGGVAFGPGLRPQDQRVDAAVGLRGANGYGAESLILPYGSMHPVFARALFDRGHDRIRDPLVNVRLGSI
jgi:hypothetical protein